MFYDRKVKYMDYCEGGERIKGCGVAKLQVRDKSLNMEVMVSGLQPEDSFQKELVIYGERGECVLGNIDIESGRGSFRFRCDDLERLPNIVPYESWMGMRIALGGDREVRCSLGQEFAERTAAEPERKREAVFCEAVSEFAERTAAEPERQREAVLCEAVSELAGRAAAEAERERERDVFRGGEAEFAECTAAEPERKCDVRREQPSRALAEDKWSQLWNIYPHVHPFRDGREYISIRPADFVLFSAESYKKINNSFLLHGFYNYHHLILAQMEKNGEKVCYVGVPGNYFEREKQVAIMFGFESFECQEEPAQAGDFGYYMMRAQI